MKSLIPAPEAMAPEEEMYSSISTLESVAPEAEDLNHEDVGPAQSNMRFPYQRGAFFLELRIPSPRRMAHEVEVEAPYVNLK